MTASKKEVLDSVKFCISQKLKATSPESKAYWQSLKEAIADIDADWKYRTPSGIHVQDI